MGFPLLPLLGAVTTIIEKIIPDPQKAAEAKVKLFELAQTGELAVLAAEKDIALAQIGVNTEEAKSPDFFRGGWRPAVGWTCVIGLSYTFVIRPLLPWTARVLGFDVPDLPALDMGELMALLTGMLGLSGFRAFERIKGKA